jgi:hypothetical protein
MEGSFIIILSAVFMERKGHPHNHEKIPSCKTLTPMSRSRERHTIYAYSAGTKGSPFLNWVSMSALVLYAKEATSDQTIKDNMP